MNTSNFASTDQQQSQQFYRQYSANAFLPDINWAEIFKMSQLKEIHFQALETLYRSSVPLALKVFEELNFDVFTPVAYHPQGLGLFEKLANQEQLLLDTLKAECSSLNDEVRHQIWSMLLRGGAVLVFKAWLAKVKTGNNQLDMNQFDELSDLLFIKTAPNVLAQQLNINIDAPYDHIFLMYGDDILLDRFNSLETAALFVRLGVYDAAFLSLRDERVADYLKEKGMVTQDQIDELQCALNPLNCDNLTPKQDCLA
ncbi:hypothetical protein [Acinetobacter rudis]|uniref:Uncharacterized protein n=1 Tax=Acinetobacter rudis TaxID=632955 RepID=A0AAW8JD71_9GAMM|nr:hypothetical protein [Acinetobacter rudis]MDQ8936887.1 hypothetical protein [Acinetobacter rudis]MDQ8954482.1 hypothetical protein [Acinetobacter rudis]MDQ9019091.1 hypothetical protein [Acinetobacter rudis]